MVTNGRRRGNAGALTFIFDGSRRVGSARRPCTDMISRVHPICHSDGSFHGDVLPFLGGFVEWRNGPAVWFARKSKTPPQSSCQVELVGINTTIKEGLHVTQLLTFIQTKLEGPMPVITDNKAAYDVIRCPGATKRTAHFERWMHFARDLMLRRAIEISLVTTNKMMADFFTKPSDKTTFFRCRSYVMNLPDA